MYLDHFALSLPPFSTSPDPRFFYPTAKHREALACVLYAVAQHKGFALLTGEVGAGKSMLCQAALDRFGPEVETALVANTLLSAKEFFQTVCYEFGLPAHGNKVALLNELREFLLDRADRGRTVVLMVDEAQNLSLSMMEEVRLLGNLETPSQKLLQIILVGQPEMRRLIASSQLRQLNQRITVKFHLGQMSAQDTQAYIDHRLMVAGAPNGALFTAQAKQGIFDATGGVPRLVNVVADQALLQAFVQDDHQVDIATIEQVLKDREGYYQEAQGPACEPGTQAYAATPSGPKFVIWGNGHKTEPFLIPEGRELALGRDPAYCDLTILDTQISRRHCVISNRAGQASIEDARSTNGTFVNKERIERAELNVGDMIQIGKTMITVSDPETDCVTAAGSSCQAARVQTPPSPQPEPDSSR